MLAQIAALQRRVPPARRRSHIFNSSRSDLTV
jgi:hypothetical protein